MTRISAAATLTIVVGAFATWTSPASAQVLGSETTVAAGGYVESYEFLDASLVGFERVSLASVPLGAQVQVVDRVGLDVRTTFARAAVAYSDGSEVSLSGLTDTEVRLNYEVIPDRVTLSGGVLLPTGNSTHSIEEAALAGLIAADLIPFRVSNWGAGGGAGLVSTIVLPAGDYAVGLTAGYTLGREFEPSEGEELAYRPGDEIRVRLAMERTIGSSTKVSMLVGGQTYREDQISGSSVFQPGDRLEALGTVSFAAGPDAAGIVYGGVQHRGTATLLSENLETPAQNLILAGGGLRVPAGFTTFVPSVDVRLFRSEDGLGQGHLTSVGANLEWPMGQLVAIPSLRARFGEALLWEGAESSIRGIDLGLGMRLRL